MDRGTKSYCCGKLFFFIAGMRMLLEWARAMASFALKPKMRRDHNILVYFQIKNIPCREYGQDSAGPVVSYSENFVN